MTGWPARAACGAPAPSRARKPWGGGPTGGRGGRGAGSGDARAGCGPGGPVHAAARGDGRPFFVLPWREMLLVGTTDIRYKGDPTAVVAGPAEVAYLLEETAALFPRAPISEEAVLYTYAGLRPLPT